LVRSAALLKIRRAAEHPAQMTELWEGATDEEREELMQSMVVRVEMNEKEEGTCEVALMPQVPSDWLGLTSRLGAGRAVTTTFNPRCHDLPLFIAPGGQSRTKIPRPKTPCLKRQL